jgi:hypothetical protein
MQTHVPTFSSAGGLGEPIVRSGSRDSLNGAAAAAPTPTPTGAGSLQHQHSAGIADL